MSDKKEIWNLARETMQAFTPFYNEATTQAILASGVPDDWYSLNLARGSEPEAFTATRYHELSPYGSLARCGRVLIHLAEMGLLEPAGEDAYRLTEKGRSSVEGVFQAAHMALAGVEPLPAGDMAQLNHLLARIVAATLEAPEPETKWALKGSRWTDPGADAAAAAKADQYITDLARFRNDAHIAAWKPHNVSGRAWEAFTYVWRGQASTAEEVAEKLSFHDHTAEAYAADLQDLAAREWLEEVDGHYQVTARGKQIREAAEEVTDRHFFVGWPALSEAEVVQLQELLTRARDSLQKDGLAKIWSLASGVSGAIFPITREAVQPALETQLGNPGFFNYTRLAGSKVLEPFSAEQYVSLTPYANPAAVSERLKAAAEAGLVAEQENGHFTITGKGQAAIIRINDTFYRRLGEIEAELALNSLEQVADLLTRLVEASLAAPAPARKRAINNSYYLHPITAYSALARIDQRLDDLNAFRDDAHMAAWEPYGVSGRTWETLTFIWRGQANTAASLAESLTFRGYTEEDYTASLAELEQRGWVEQAGAGYGVTAIGRNLRQEAEETTERYFFAPWAALDSQEQLRLADLLARLKSGLQKLAEPAPEATT